MMAVKLIAKTPKPVDSVAMMDALRNGMLSYAPFIEKDFRGTVAAWKSVKPVFKTKFSVEVNLMALRFYVSGSLGYDKWWWLNNGTPAHPITPKRGKFLAFPEGSYRAGSSVKSLQVNASNFTPTGGTVYAKKVMHPGIQAREWTEVMKENHLKSFRNWMHGAMRRAAYASKHSWKQALGR